MIEIPAFMKESGRPPSHPYGSNPFIDRGLIAVTSVIRNAYTRRETSSASGFLQRIDTRIKTASLIFFIISISLARTPGPMAAVLLMCLFTATATRIATSRYVMRVSFIALFFGTLVTLPASLNVITPGGVVLPLFHMEGPVNWWIYTIPADIGITRQGLETVLLMTLRVGSSAAVVILVLSTTPFPEVIRSLKCIHVPDSFLMILFMAYRHIFLFALTVEEFYMALKSRTITHMSAKLGRTITANRMGHLFMTSMRRADQVYIAMRARGYTGEIHLAGFPPLTIRQAGSIVAVALLCCAVHFTGDHSWPLFMK